MEGEIERIMHKALASKPLPRRSCRRLLYAAAVLALVCAAPLQADNPFAWVPSYPGARILTTSTTRGDGQLVYKFTFHTGDSGAAVRKFYEDKLKVAGFNVIGKGGITGNSWDLYGDSADGTKRIDINGNARPKGVDVGVTARAALAGAR